MGRKVKHESPAHVITTLYKCPQCGEKFERVVLVSDEGKTVIKHWSKCCSGCGNKNLVVVGASNHPLTDGKLYTWDEKKL